VIGMAWTRESDADAYSISWAQDRALPDETADLNGDATDAESPPLAPGSWYFNLRTHGNGEWTSTVRVGPFVILGDQKAHATPPPVSRRWAGSDRSGPARGARGVRLKRSGPSASEQERPSWA
jgi:hypothetical protein